LALGGCEAIVEGFYSLVKVHEKVGGQTNDHLMKRAIVDWCIPHPISCTYTIRDNTTLYRDGSRDLHLKKHCYVFDKRQRASEKYDISKVLDRIP